MAFATWLDSALVSAAIWSLAMSALSLAARTLTSSSMLDLRPSYSLCRSASLLFRFHKRIISNYILPFCSLYVFNQA
ncbi:hypothetical protein R3P38DRAFT_1449613 [Favolaschia claudopus]|uniref:Secreted protein n=1 Tax=Favolaschia claudopus TaxID=2862362 RepID=A0AAW0AM99_9AGAR